MKQFPGLDIDNLTNRHCFHAGEIHFVCSKDVQWLSVKKERKKEISVFLHLLYCCLLLAIFHAVY